MQGMHVKTVQRISCSVHPNRFEWLTDEVVIVKRMPNICEAIARDGKAVIV